MGRSLAAIALLTASGVSALATASSVSAAPSDTTYEVVSVSTTGVATTGQHLDPQISTDGRYVKFDTDANTLVPDDSGGLDTFVRDRVSGTIERATLAGDGSEPNGGMFFHSSRMSADGRHVIFTSVGTNLVAGDTNGSADVFLRDLDTNTTELISVGPAGEHGNYNSQGGDVSGDGRFVVFYSAASNFGVPGNYGDVWLRDRTLGTTTLVVAGDSTTGSVGAPRISADGNVIAYVVIAPSTNKLELFAYNRQLGTTQRVDVRNDGTPGDGYHKNSFELSNDGNQIAFEDDGALVPSDANGQADVYVRDLSAGTTELAGVSSNGTQPAAATNAAISGDGRFVGFTVASPLPAPAGWDPGTDVYVHDRVGGSTWHVGTDGYGVNSAYSVALDSTGLIAATVATGDGNSGLDPHDGNRYVYVATRTPDTLPPVVTGSTNIAPSPSGWYNSAPTITWSGFDPLPSWGQPPTPPPTTAALEGDNVYTSAPVCDRAAHCATGSLEIKLDTTAPVATLASPPDGAFVAQNQEVVASYACADEAGGSTIDSCDGTAPSGQSIDTSTAGTHTFSVTATDGAGNTETVSATYNVVAPVQVSTTLPDGGGSLSTDTGGTGPTADAPVQTTVDSPNGGTTMITVGGDTQAAPAGYSLFGLQVNITAPPGDVAAPLTLRFALDGALLAAAGLDLNDVAVFRDGAAIVPCTDPGTAVAAPDPCVFARTALSGGDAEIDVYTSHASHWNLGAHLATPPLAVATTSLPDATVGVAYSASVAVTGGASPYVWSLTSGALPAGLTLDPTTGAITGVPIAAATSPFVARATDATRPTVQTASANLSIAVAPTANPARAQAGVPYWSSVAAFNGVAPYHWSLRAGHLPDGLSIDAATGVISGAPSAEGSFKFTVRITDSKAPLPSKVSRRLSILVGPAAITVSPSTLPTPIKGTPYSHTFVASGGLAPYTYAVTSGALPRGLRLSNAGVLSGKASKRAAFTFTVTATDKFAFTGSRSYTVTVT